MAISNILVKTEGSSSIGFGHVSRVLTLLQTFHTGCAVHILINDNAVAVHHFSDRGYNVFSGVEEVSPLLPFDHVLIDQQQFDPEFIRYCRSSGCQHIVALDQFQYSWEAVDTIINIVNQNSTQEIPPFIEYHEGLQYCIIRDGFFKFRDNTKEYRKTIENIVVIFGGSDLKRHTETVIDFLAEEYSSCQVNIILGPLVEHRQMVSGRLALTQLNWQLFNSPDNIEALMAGADLAFSGCGTTFFELGYLGIPTIVLPQSVAEENLAHRLLEENLILPGPLKNAWEAIQDQAAREVIGNNALRIFDGKGAHRIRDIILGPH